MKRRATLALALFAQGCALIYDFDDAASGGGSSVSSSSTSASGGSSPSSSTSTSSSAGGSGAGEPATSASSGGGEACAPACIGPACLARPTATPGPPTMVSPSGVRPIAVERLDATGAFVAAINDGSPGAVQCNGLALVARVLRGTVASNAQAPAWDPSEQCVGSTTGLDTLTASARGGNRAIVALNSSAGAPLTLSWTPVPAATPDPIPKAFGLVVTLPGEAPTTQGLLFHDAQGAVTVDRLTSLDDATDSNVNGWFALGTSAGTEVRVVSFSSEAPAPTLVSTLAPGTFLYWITGAGPRGWWSFALDDATLAPRAMTRENRSPIALLDAANLGGAVRVTASDGSEAPPRVVHPGELVVAETRELVPAAKYELRLGALALPAAEVCPGPVLVDAVGVATATGQDLVALFTCTPAGADDALARFAIQRFAPDASRLWSSTWTRLFTSDLALGAPKLTLVGDRVLLAAGARKTVVTSVPPAASDAFALEELEGGTVGFAAWLDAGCGSLVKVAPVAGYLQGLGVAGVLGGAPGAVHGVLTLGNAPSNFTVTPVFNAFFGSP